MQVLAELVQQPVVQPHGDRIEGAAGQVHVAARQSPGVVPYGERVAQLDAERETARRRHLLQRRDELHGTAVLQVVRERLVGHLDLAESEVVAEDRPHGLWAKQRRIQLHHRVQAALLQAVTGDPLDLVGPAPVHGRQRHAVDDGGRKVDVGQAREVPAERGPDLPERFGRVGQRVHEPPYPLVADAGQVVADAHVEDRVRRAEAEDARQDVDERPGHDVLVGRLVEGQFLRPLDVVALVGHVDARPRDDEVVADLDRLQLDEAAAGQPRRHDVLAELRMRAGRRPEGGRERLAEQARHAERVSGRVEERRGDVEDRALGFVFGQRAPELGPEWLDAHHVGHGREQATRDRWLQAQGFGLLACRGRRQP